MSVLHERIAKRRKELGLSQEELAEIIGTHQRQVSRYETAQNDPTADVLVSLANALNTTTDWLVGMTDSVSKQSREDLSEDERRMLEIYRRKSPDQRRQALEVLKVL